MVTAVVKAVPEEARDQVTVVCADRCSGVLHSRMAHAFPRFHMLCLDPTHLVIAYEAASARKKTPGSVLLREIMRRFCMPFEATSQRPPMCSYIFNGQHPPPMTRREKVCRNWLANKNMPAAAARALAGAQKYAGPWESREKFTAALAALCTLYPAEVERMSPGPNRKIIDILLSGTQWPMQKYTLPPTPVRFV